MSAAHLGPHVADTEFDGLKTIGKSRESTDLRKTCLHGCMVTGMFVSNAGGWPTGQFAEDPDSQAERGGISHKSPVAVVV